MHLQAGERAGKWRGMKAGGADSWSMGQAVGWVEGAQAAVHAQQAAVAARQVISFSGRDASHKPPSQKMHYREWM